MKAGMESSGPRVTEDRVFVGLDWGNEHHQLCAVDGSGQLVGRQRVSHDVKGLAALDVTLGRWRPMAGIAIERGEGLLVEHLLAAGHRVFCVSPRMSARARERYRLAPTKSDAFDAYVLADSLRHEHGHWRPLVTPSPELAELRALTRDRERLVWNQRDVENQLRAILAVYHPAACTCSPAWTGTSPWPLSATTPHRRTPAASGRAEWPASVIDTGIAAAPARRSWSNASATT